MFSWNPQNWLLVSGDVTYEAIITTRNNQETNFAPMGLQFETEEIIIRPFPNTRTFHLLEKNRECVVNICWDVRPFVVGALKCNVEGYHPTFVESIQILTKRLASSIGWLECSVLSIDTSSSLGRGRVALGMLHHESTGQVVCPNRADTAILEATIHATRVQLCTSMEEKNKLKSLICTYLRLARRISSAQHHRASIAAIARKIGLEEDEISSVEPRT